MGQTRSPTLARSGGLGFLIGTKTNILIDWKETVGLCHTASTPIYCCKIAEYSSCTVRSLTHYGLLHSNGVKGSQFEERILSFTAAAICYVCVMSYFDQTVLD